MKALITGLLLILSFQLIAQKSDCDIKLSILENIFIDYTISNYDNKKVFETKVWNEHAVIPIDKCRLVKFESGIVALAFNIYLSADPEQYRYMIEEQIYNMIDISETTMFQGGSQRLIQVLFFDIKNNKLLGKGENFPLKGFTWLPEGMGDVTNLNSISEFKKLGASPNTCILSLDECPSCLGGLHYVFKFYDNKVITSEGISACYEYIQAQNRKMYMQTITNCYELEFSDEEPELTEVLLFQW